MRIGSTGSEGASELTEELETTGDMAEEEIGTGGSPASGDTTGFNGDSVAHERGSREEVRGEV
jgi:hypothetical protein